jgi:hypothetical protein
MSNSNTISSAGGGTVNTGDMLPHPLFVAVWDHPTFRAIEKPISIHHLETMTEDDVVDYKFLHACLIKVKQAPLGGKTDLKWGSRGSPLSGSQKSPRFNITGMASYRRMLTFADLKSNVGQNFVVLECSETDEQEIWDNGRHAAFRVGDCFAIIEPEAITKYISNSVPIVSSSRGLVGIQSPGIPKIAFTKGHLNNQFFFACHNIQLRFSTFQLVKTQCNGSFCDRQRKTGSNEPCGCYTMNSRNAGQSLVAQVNIHLPPQTAGETKTIRNFRSLRMMDLLFNRPLPPVVCNKVTTTEVISQLRGKFDAIAKHVNENGGWTIAAWHRRSSVNDASGQGQSEVTSDLLKMNVIYLYPTVVLPKDVSEMQFDVESLTECAPIPIAATNP